MVEQEAVNFEVASSSLASEPEQAVKSGDQVPMTSP